MKNLSSVILICTAALIYSVYILFGPWFRTADTISIHIYVIILALIAFAIYLFRKGNKDSD